MGPLRLEKLQGYRAFPGPVVCVVMDGVGMGKRDESDAVYLANTPTLDRLYVEDLFLQLKAHGTAVGMPSDGDMGNSEVGHNALGAGRIFDQGAKLVQQLAVRMFFLKVPTVRNCHHLHHPAGEALDERGMKDDVRPHDESPKSTS